MEVPLSTRWGTPCLPFGVPPIKKGVPPILTWKGGTPCPHPDLGSFTPSPPPTIDMWTDKQTENSILPHPSDAGGNKWQTCLLWFVPYMLILLLEFQRDDNYKPLNFLTTHKDLGDK